MTADASALHHHLITCSTGFARTLWNATAFSSRCAAPYDCGDGFLTDSTKLLPCSAPGAPQSFFGAPRLGPDLGSMEGQFFEFLQTIGEAHILKRPAGRPARPGGARRRASGIPVGKASAADGDGDGASDAASDQKLNDSASRQQFVLVDPSAYLDFQTREVEVTIAAFSADLGIASLIRIVATVSSQVSVDYLVEHYQSTEGERLAAYRAVAGCAMAFSLIIFAEKIWVIYSKLHSVRGVTPDDRKDFVFEIFLQCCLPLAYFSMRLAQLERSGYLVDHTVGEYGLAGVSSARDSHACKVAEGL